MADDWYYTQGNERRGPVPFAKLRAVAADGWLARDDLVWRPGMPAWVPAKEVSGLFLSTLGPLLHKTIVGLRTPQRANQSEYQVDSRPPSIPERVPQKKPQRRRQRPAEINLGNLSMRHCVAACGGFLAALGIAFTAVAQSRVALAFTLSGFFIAAVGLYVEIGSLLGQAIENIGKALGAHASVLSLLTSGLRSVAKAISG